MNLLLFIVAMLWFFTWLVFAVFKKNPNDKVDKFMNEGKGE